MRKTVLFFLYIAIFARGAGPVKADVVYLKDGGILAGTAVAGPQEDKILFRTAYGELVIPKSLILKVDYGTFDVGRGQLLTGMEKPRTPFNLRFVASPGLGLGFAGGGDLSSAQTSMLLGGEAGVDLLRWLSLRVAVGTGTFGKYSTGSGGPFGSFSSESEVRSTYLLLDALYALRLGRAVFDLGFGPGLYFTRSRVPWQTYNPNTQTYQTSEYNYSSEDFGVHGTVAYRFFISEKLSIDLRNRFHVLVDGSITYVEGALGGVSVYF